MPVSTDVTLAIDQPPLWPARCIGCYSKDTSALFRFRASRVGLDQLFTLHFAMGSRPKIEVPTCPDCAKQLRRSRWISGLISWPLYIILGGFTLYAIDKLGWQPTGPFRKWIMAGEVILVLMPLFFWDMFHPPVIDVTAKGKKLDYEFRDAAYAHDFAELNDAEVF